MCEASTVNNPWIALQLRKLNAMHNCIKMWKPNVAIANAKYAPVTLTSPKSNRYLSRGTQVHPLYQNNQLSQTLAQDLARVRRRNHVKEKWKAAAHKILCFRPNLILHRQIPNFE